MALDPHDNISDPRNYLHYRSRLPSLAQFPDSPSVYSPTYVDTPNFSRIPDPAACLQYDDDDDDEETASTIRSLSAEDVPDDSDFDDSNDDASHRISLPGPRIRFHSRAPWETDDDTHHEEPANSPRFATTGNKLLKGKGSRADTLMRTLTRNSFITGRPSVDSARSQASTIPSFEIPAGNYPGSRGALYHLAKESISTTSLSSSVTSTSVRQQSFAPMSIHPGSSCYFTQTYSSLPRATVSLDGVTPPSMPQERAVLHPSSDAFRMGQECHPSPSPSQERPSRDDFVHPYANPDLVASYTPSPESIPSRHLISRDISSSDSNCTVADSTSVRSATFSDISTETSSTSLTSRDHPHGNPRVNGKEISSPISVIHQNDAGYVDRSTRFLSLHPPPSGFDSPHHLNPRSATVTLISLQEAQARERVRGNTVHATVARPNPSLPDPDDIPETLEDRAEETDAVGTSACMRARSTSVGTRHPTAPTQVTEMGDGSALLTATNAAPGRALKHKKSGFMRLFTGRTSEGDKEKYPHQAIPPYADVVPAKQSLQLHGKISKNSLSKAPKPLISPTLASTNNVSTVGDSPDGKRPSPRRRQPPPLSIVTGPSDHNISVLGSGRNSSSALTFTPPPPLSLTVPQSAPPGGTDFRGLNLRPVSTSFSSHFADMVATGTDEAQRSVRTPSSVASSGAALSPLTPVSMRRSDDTSATAPETSGAEDFLTVKELQDQLLSAKTAWQQQIWELRGQIRDLTAELEDLRAAEDQEYCDLCGRGKAQKRHASPLEGHHPKKTGVLNRPRAPTGDAARFSSGN